MIAKLKEIINSAKTDEEIYSLSKDLGHKLIALSDEDLDKIAGGAVCRPDCVKKRNKCWCES